MVVKNTYGKRRKSSKDTTKAPLEARNDKEDEEGFVERQLYGHTTPETQPRTPPRPPTHTTPKSSIIKKHHTWKEMVPDIAMSPSPRKRLRTSLYGDLSKTPSPRKNHGLHEDFYAIADSQESSPKSDSSPRPIPKVRARQPVTSASRLTYGDQRSFLQKDAEDPIQANPFAALRATEESNAVVENTPIKSVHELREAGNNKRFVDEMDYLQQSLSPSKPLTIRRSSLLEIAEKLQSMEYCRKLRASGLDLQLFPEPIFDEVDPIILFLTAFSLCILATDDHIQRAWAENERLIDFFIRCTKLDGDIVQTIKNKSTQLSRVNQSVLLGLVDRLTVNKDIMPTMSIQLLAMTTLDSIVRSANADSKLTISKVGETYDALMGLTKSTPTEFVTAAKTIEVMFSLLEALISLQILDDVNGAAAYAMSMLLRLREELNASTIEVYLSCVRFIIKGTTLGKYQQNFERTVKDDQFSTVLSDVLDTEVWRVDSSEKWHQDKLVFSLGVLISFASSENLHAFMQEDSALSGLCTMANEVAHFSKTKRDETCFGYLALFIGCLSEDATLRQIVKDALHSYTCTEFLSSLTSLKTHTQPHQTSGEEGLTAHIDASLSRLKEVGK